MGKKHLKLWLLIMCFVIALGMFTGCKKKKSKTTEAPTTTTTTAEETSQSETTAPTTTEASKETSEITEAPTTTTTEATTESTTEATTEPTTESTTEATKKTKDTTPTTTAPVIDENGTYTSKDDVALYIHTYGHLPSNFVTKKEAQAKGWEGGSLEDYFPGCSIGGDKFGNREGLLPSKKGRTYTECDIDTKGKKSRGAKRIVFSNDGLIYYTDDHYETFTLLYGEE